MQGNQPAMGGVLQTLGLVTKDGLQLRWISLGNDLNKQLKELAWWLSG